MLNSLHHRSSISRYCHFACLFVALAFASVISAHAQSIEYNSKRGFTPADAKTTGTSGPPLLFGSLKGSELEEARDKIALYDRQLSAAFMKADEAFARLGNPHTLPVFPAVGTIPGDSGSAPEMYKQSASNLVISKENGVSTALNEFKALKVSSSSRQAGCSGNCYQSDRLFLADPGDDMYASEYWVWLAVPRENELNACDGPPHGSGCFWFYAINHSTNAHKTAFHIGPQRGASLAGNAGANWRMNIDGYINGVHVGGQSSVNLPVATWMRIRTWRINKGRDSQAPYTPWATWGVWALYNGVDHYLGSLTIDGDNLTDATLFSEVWEQNGQCTTDLERGYLGWPRYWRPGQDKLSFSSATANYEANCGNTSWEIIGDQFVRDERNTTRTLFDGESAW